jgi:hypothetical protein
MPADQSYYWDDQPKMRHLVRRVERCKPALEVDPPYRLLPSVAILDWSQPQPAMVGKTVFHISVHMPQTHTASPAAGIPGRDVGFDPLE